MKIAYLILCHTDPKHIRRLAEKVTKGTENAAFVHIDKTADGPAFRQALEGLPHVHVLKNNRKVWWGVLLRGRNRAVDAGGALL